MLSSCQDFVHNFRAPLFILKLPYQTEPNSFWLSEVRVQDHGCLFFFCPSLSHQDQTVSVGTKYTGRLTCFNLPLPPMLSWVSRWMTGFLIFPFHPLIIIWDGCMALPALWISSSCCYECQQFLNGSHGLALYWSLPCCVVLRNGHITEYKSYQSSEFSFLRFSLYSLGIHRAIGLPAC